MKMKKIKILYVEDNHANIALVRRLLSNAGYDVLVAEDGMEGIKVARQELPHLILMDINLPGMDGYEASTKIKGMAQLKEVPIVAVTANVNPGDRERSLAAGCDGYISKPINVKTFVGEIEKYLGGKKERLKKSEESAYLKEYSQRLVDALEEKIEDLERSNEELGAANDDLKMSKIALEDAYERLLEMDRIKSDFVANVSHELRTPLTSIKSYTEILYDEIEELDVDEQRRFLGIIDREADRLTRLICDLLDLRKMESGEMSWRDKELDIAGLIEETIHDCHSYASSRGTKISLQVEGDIPMIFIDRDKIKQVTTNLLSNAIKFSPEGAGEVEVSIDISGDMSTEVAKGPGNKSDIVVSVRDYGVGIEEGDLDNLFSRFYQGKSSESVAKTAGTGLGLSISRDIVEHYGGRIWAESILGDGATFRFSLPVEIGNETLVGNG